MSYHPVTVQHLNATTEDWAGDQVFHATQINKAGGSESFNAGAGQYHLRLTFDLRWCSALERLRFNPQEYRLLYGGHAFNIVDYDDYMEQHRVVRLTGEAYE